MDSPSSTHQPGRAAHELFDERFTIGALSNTYEEKIAEKRAVGRDGITQEMFKAKLDDEIRIVIRKVRTRTYKFTTFREKLISKGPKKNPRVISIPTVRDRLTLRTVNDILVSVFPEGRVYRPHTYIKRIRERLAETKGEIAFIRVDVQDFYPSIDHVILRRKLRARIRKAELIDLIFGAISTPTGEETPPAKGVPQGLSISNILASIYLMAFDSKMTSKLGYFRYVDDILVIDKPTKSLRIFNSIQKQLKQLGLACHPLGKKGKSQITDGSQGVEYLGFKITPARISVRESSFTKMIENLLGVLTGYRHAKDKQKSQEKLVWQLNLKITGCIYETVRYGWVFFFSQIDDVQQLGRLDSFVTAELTKRGLAILRPKIKRFTRAYHEITKNLSKTKYIPNFDKTSVDEMILALSTDEGLPVEQYRQRMTEQQIRKRFARMIRRQTRELERDLIEAIS